MQKGQKGIGLKKHGRGGRAPGHTHFSGKKGGKRIRRKGSTKRERRLKRGTHKNKYKSNK